MNALLQLAERAEAAPGPDNDLSREVALGVGWKPVPNPTHMGGLMGRWYRPDGSMTGHEGFPPFTSSIDAAMLLVPEGWEAAIYCAPKGSVGVNANVQMETEEMRRQASFFPIDSIAATPALALVAAALRARAACDSGRSEQPLTAEHIAALLSDAERDDMRDGNCVKGSNRCACKSRTAMRLSDFGLVTIKDGGAIFTPLGIEVSRLLAASVDERLCSRPLAGLTGEAGASAVPAQQGDAQTSGDLS